MPLDYILGPKVSAPIGPANGIAMRLGDDARKCVAFFGLPDEKTGEIKYGGTGFFVEYDESGHTFRYLITAKHVARRLDAANVIRLNLHSGGSEKLPFDVVDWAHHPSADISAVRFNWENRFDVVPFHLKHRLTEEKRESKLIMGGDIAYVVGLFRLHAGDQRNLPLVHTGHIALAPDRDELIPIADRLTGETIDSYVYLIEAQTLDGLSGSPVFTRRGVKTVQAPGQASAVKPLGYAAVFLLGVYLGSWEAEPGKILAEDRSLSSNKVRVPIGVGVVAPADKIVEVLMQDEMREARRKEIANRRAARAAVTDSALPTKADNPQYETA